jgi:predicted glycoside hydrolase/deacetylase ChbG (UPF0249 family)
VILNADDFGLSEGVCEGIVEAICYGCVTATTAMAAVPGSAERLARWAPFIAGRIGAHLQLTSGTPVLAPELVPTLVRDGGVFPKAKKDLQTATTEHIVQEWHAQVQTLQKIGIRLTHIDSHHQVHKFPHIFRAFVEIARHYRLAARALDSDMARELRAAGVACADRTLLGWYGGELSVSRLLRLLEEGAAECRSPAVMEVMCHPGRMDSTLAGISKYLADRESELRILADPGVKAQLAKAGFTLCGFAEAFGAGPG